MTQSLKVLEKKINARLARLKEKGLTIQKAVESFVFQYYLQQLEALKANEETLQGQLLIIKLIKQIKYPSLRIKLDSELPSNENLHEMYAMALHGNYGDGDGDLLEAVIEANPDIVNTVFNKETALVTAVKQNKLALVKIFVTNHFKADSPNAKKALTAAVTSGNLDTVQLLLEAGVIPSQRAFQIACSQGTLKIAEELDRVNRAGPANEKFDYNKALLSVVFEGNLQGVKFLVNEKQADVDYSEEAIFKSNRNTAVFTPLRAAIENKHPQVAEFLLIDCKANYKKVQEALKMTTFKLAAFLGMTKEEFANIQSYTPLMRAAQKGNMQTIKELIQAGANNVNDKANDGHTALIEAVIKRDITAVQTLLQVEDIDFNARTNNAHLSAREIALKNGDTKIVKTLDNFVASRIQEKKFLPQSRLYQLNAIIDDYHALRTNEKDKKGNTKEYLYENVFGLFQKSYTQKNAAVTDLKRALRGKSLDAKGNPIDLNIHLSTLRNKRLGDYLRKFIKQGHANCIFDKPIKVTTVREFVKALQDQITERALEEKSSNTINNT